MSWNKIMNPETNKEQNGGSGSDVYYVKLPVGVVTLRLLDAEPKSRWTHWVPQANGGKGMSVNCLGKGCPVCREINADKKAGRAKKYSSVMNHVINVFHKSTKENGVVTEANKVGILDKGNKIYTQLGTLLDQMGGDPTAYEVTITRIGQDAGSTQYTVLPVYPPTPMSAEVAAMPKYNLDEVLANQNFTAEQVELLLQGKTVKEVRGNGDMPVADAPTSAVNASNTTYTAPNVDFTARA